MTAQDDLFAESGNNVFSLTLRYGVGVRDFPKLGIAADCMNNAGIMGTYEPQH
jgi:hypothetical protein